MAPRISTLCPGWSGTRYLFAVGHPGGTGGLVAAITGHFTFSDFGRSVSVTPPPAGRVGEPGEGRSWMFKHQS